MTGGARDLKQFEGKPKLGEICGLKLEQLSEFVFTEVGPWIWRRVLRVGGSRQEIQFGPGSRGPLGSWDDLIQRPTTMFYLPIVNFICQ